MSHSILSPSSEGREKWVFPFYKKIIKNYSYKIGSRCSEETFRFNIKTSKSPWITPDIAWLMSSSNRIRSLHEGHFPIREMLELPPPKLRFIFREPGPEYIGWALQRISKDAAITESQVRFSLYGSEDGVILNKIKDALEIIRRTWNDAYVELSVLLRTVIFLNGDWLRSCSLPSTFGAVYICPRKNWNSIDYADILIHESAHHYLDCVHNHHPLINNPDSIAQHPIRDDPRPIYSCLHASFVLAKLILFHRTLFKYCSPEQQTYSKSLVNEYETMLHSSLLHLKKNAEFTTTGILLYNEMLELII